MQIRKKLIFQNVVKKKMSVTAKFNIYPNPTRVF